MIGRVEALAKGGRGIVFVEGKPVFLDGVLKGELVEFSISEKKRSVFFGVPEKIIEAAAERITPPCPYYEQCGGCNFQHILYEEQAAIKEDILKSNLRRIAKIDYPDPVEVITSPPYRYRTKAVLKIKAGKTGFFRKERHDIIEINSCLLLPQVVEDFLPQLRNHPAVENTGTGDIFILSDGREFSALLKSGRNEQYICEKKNISFEIGDFVYSVKPRNFIQANLFTLQPMIRLVTRHLEKESVYAAVDLFCGAGFFTLPLARIAREVTAVEVDGENLRSLSINLKKNKIDNVKIEQADILKAELPEADIFLVDPPRRGLGRSVVASIIAGKPRQVFYFSCDSATFARDSGYFREAVYAMSGLTIIDNFPQTDHFEIFSCFSPVIDDITAEIYFKQKVDKSLKQIDEKKVVSHEEVKGNH